MRSLVFADVCANKDHYILALPRQMNHWRLESLYDYLVKNQSDTAEEGYIPVPLEPLHFEQLRQFLICPELSMNAPAFLCQDGVRIDDDGDIIIKEGETVIEIDREDADFADFVGKVSVKKRNLLAFASCRTVITAAIDKLLDLEEYPVTTKAGDRLSSFSEIVESFGKDLVPDQKLSIIWRLARILYAAPFENISRIIHDRQSRPGYSVWLNIANGYGGVCAEKTAAFAFVCDVLGVHRSAVLGAVNGLPDDYEDQLLEYASSGGEGDVPPWAQHHILEIRLCGEEYMVDVTNGNIPFLFLEKSDADHYIRAGMRSRMVYNTEKIMLKRSTELGADILLTLGEYHIPELHLQYIFNQGLGLHISANMFIGVYFDWGGEESALKQTYYSSLAKKVGFPYPRFIHEENIASVPDEEMQKVLHELLSALRIQYANQSYTGDFTFVLQQLSGNFWKNERISRSVLDVLEKGTGQLTTLMGGDIMPMRL